MAGVVPRWPRCQPQRPHRCLVNPAGSGTYGIKQTRNQGGGYTGVASGMAGCSDTVVAGSGDYSQALTGPLDSTYGWYTTGGDAALVAALQTTPLKVCSSSTPLALIGWLLRLSAALLG